MPVIVHQHLSALDSRHGLLDISRVSRAVRCNPFIDQDEQLLSFTFWQLLQLRNDCFLKSHDTESFCIFNSGLE